jgi:hypothetical protein
MHHMLLTSTMLCVWQQAMANYHVAAVTVFRLHQNSNWINPKFSVHSQSNFIMFLEIYKEYYIPGFVGFFIAEWMAGQCFRYKMPCQLVKSYWRFGITSCPHLQDLNIPRRGLLKPWRWKQHAQETICLPAQFRISEDLKFGNCLTFIGF